MHEFAPYSPADWDACLRVLRAIGRGEAAPLDEEELKGLVTRVYRRGRKESRRAAAEERARTEDPAEAPAETAPLLSAEPWEQRCWLCTASRPVGQVHPQYPRLCPACAELNWAKRHQTADLRGRVALVSGGRVKSGLQTTLKLLRAGAEVHITTRFPQDARRRFAREADRREWGRRLHVHGLDFRDLPRLEDFCRHLSSALPSLDILVNNAAQTLRPPVEVYAALVEGERRQLIALAGSDPEPEDTLPLPPEDLPDGTLVTSWVRRLDEVDLVEMLEVQLVNVSAPFLLCARLKPLLARSPHARRFIVNVTASEGQFSRARRLPTHPHTNMAKAALNMMTATAARDYARSGIFMTSVDPGWFSDMAPEPRRAARAASDFAPPLDAVDAAARILDPVYRGLTQDQTPDFGVLLKNYAPSPW